MTVSIPNDLSTVALSANSTAVKLHAVWFQNFSTTAGIYLIANGTAAAT